MSPGQYHRERPEQVPHRRRNRSKHPRCCPLSAPGVSNDVVVACLRHVQQQPATARHGHGQPSCQVVANAAACSREQDVGIRGSEDTLLVACNLHGDACKRDSSGIGRSAPPEEVDAAAAAGGRGGAQRRHCCRPSGGAGPRATHRHSETRSGGDGDAEPGASSPWGRGVGAPACGVAPGVCCAAPSRRCRGRRPAHGDQGVDEQGCVHPLAEPASGAQAAGAAGCASSVFASNHAAQRRHGQGPCPQQAGRAAGWLRWAISDIQRACTTVSRCRRLTSSAAKYAVRQPIECGERAEPSPPSSTAGARAPMEVDGTEHAL